MSAERAPRIVLCLALGAAALAAVLEVELAGSSGARPDVPWQSSLREMDRALARGDIRSAATAREDAYRAAFMSRRWEALLAAGDATLQLGEAVHSRRAAEAEARRCYLSALFRARAARSLDGVLRVTEAFVRLGDREVVQLGIRIAYDLAGEDEVAQERVRVVAQRWASRELSSSALDPQLTRARAL
jgi:hypothetical protein